MNYIYIILAVIAAAFLVYFNTAINNLKLENASLTSSLNSAVYANQDYKKTIESLSSDYQKRLEVLANLKQEKQKEIRYVTQVKERIIKDNNSTCIDAINAIYARLHEQRDSNKQAIRDAKN
ncbi:hypothetical protein ACLH6Q_000695 [Campylobacter fetus]|uniref:hypothetical protein n=1 Tax=Campylobacter fetus TaxID=196 RepID=UPI000818B683|nr:hypothetical protein [Campylobacter fetus]EAH8300447.1 hypothetical protein [Campylobacter fetus]EAI7232866.1 hypothetical protein [Campylobacter fetus]EAJ5690378.1 hypothetical protein [Campylobacter fetus]EAK5304684.1 hypothetical protein [Campylobacter fetus]EAM0407580.1 hypothetical protein [Campylobacter fetus]